jgi:hypothetical protein
VTERYTVQIEYDFLGLKKYLSKEPPRLSMTQADDGSRYMIYFWHEPPLMTVPYTTESMEEALAKIEEIKKEYPRYNLSVQTLDSIQLVYDLLKYQSPDGDILRNLGPIC